MHRFNDVNQHDIGQFNLIYFVLTYRNKKKKTISLNLCNLYFL